MSTIAMQMSNADAEVVRKFAEFEGKTISEFIMDTVFEKIESHEDLATLRSAIADDDGTRYTHAEVLKELGI